MGHFLVTYDDQVRGRARKAAEVALAGLKDVVPVCRARQERVGKGGSTGAGEGIGGKGGSVSRVKGGEGLWGSSPFSVPYCMHISDDLP